MIAQQSSAVAIVPQGHSINSPALQCQVRVPFVLSPKGTAETVRPPAHLLYSTWLYVVPACLPPQRSPPHACAPGGDGRSEGELNCSSGRKPAHTAIPAPDFWILNSDSNGVPRLLKPYEAFSSLLKGKNKNHFFFWAAADALAESALRDGSRPVKVLLKTLFFPITVTVAYESTIPKPLHPFFAQ